MHVRHRSSTPERRDRVVRRINAFEYVLKMAFEYNRLAPPLFFGEPDVSQVSLFESRIPQLVRELMDLFDSKTPPSEHITLSYGVTAEDLCMYMMATR